MESEQTRELALRTHIRNLLLNYSLTHLATNYVTWTQDTVNELLSRRLSYVPATDPTDLLLPSDTYEHLLRLWKLEKIQPYNETLTSDARTLQVLKTHLQGFKRRERPTVKCWNVDADINYSQWLMLRPMSPVLSNASIRRTPRPGLLTGEIVTPHNWNEVLRDNNLRAVQSEDLPEEPPPKLQDVLQLRLASDVQTQKDIAALFKSVATLSKRPAAASDIHQDANAFLRADSPPVELPRLASPPLFPRDRRPGYNSSSTGSPMTHLGLDDLTDLPTIVPPVAPGNDVDEELYKQHMVVVDGWHTYAVPSSPLTPGTPSLGDSSSEVDELMQPSSPGHDRPLIEEVTDARLDEYEMPRSRKIGNTQEKPKAGHGQSLSSFLSPLRHRPGSLPDQAKIVTSPKSHPSSPHTAITASMLGQPPTMFDGAGTGDSDFIAYNDPPSEGSDPDTDILLRRIYGEELVMKDAARIVMDEKMDERDSLLMDVPVLPPPSDHAPPAMFLPQATGELLIPVKPKRQVEEQVTTLAVSGHLKNATGMQALNIELSWIPFKYGFSIPADDEVTGVAGTIGYGLATALQDEDPALETQLADLLNAALNLETCMDEGDNVPSTMIYLDYECDPEDFASVEDYVGEVDIILTRDERRAVRGEVAYNDADLGSSDKWNEGPPTYDPGEAGSPTPKRVRSTNLRKEEETRYDDFPQAAVTTDDFYMSMSPSHVVGSCVGSFSELGYHAQGFEGASADGDLFDDIDPVHELGFDSGVSATHTGCGVPLYADLGSPDGHITWVARQDTAAGTAALYATSPMNSPPVSGAELAMPFVDQTDVHDRSYARIPKTSNVPEEPHNRATDHLEMMINGTSVELSAALPSARRNLSEFLALIGKGHVSPRSSPDMVNCSLKERPVPVQEEPWYDCPPAVPADLLDPGVLFLPDSGLQPTTVHRYMASIALLQKRVLVRCLASRESCVELVEREDLGDADLILDPETAVILASLAALPSQADATLARLTRLSWRYSHILLVLEAYPDSLSIKRDSTSPRVVSYPFSAVAVKAAKKLRRDVNIAKACETLRADSWVSFAYAVSPEEAASYVRVFGDDAQTTRDTTQGALWGAREWLDFDEREGEFDLGGVDGMNMFAASIILSQMSLDDFLDTSPQDRVQYFGPYVGHDRLVRFNKELARRTKAVQLESSSPISIESRTSA